MANTQRGEVEVKGHGGAVYLFKLGTDAICRLEATLDRPVLTLFEELQQGKMRLTTVRAFVKASALSPVDDAGASAIIDDVGVIPMLGAMTQSLLVVFQVETPKNGNPPKPARKKERMIGAGNSNVPPK